MKIVEIVLTEMSDKVADKKMQFVLTEGAKKFILDLSSVESCDSSGLSAILVANRILNSTNGQMRIASPSEKVYSLIKITQLDRVLPVCDSVEEAFKDLMKIN